MKSTRSISGLILVSLVLSSITRSTTRALPVNAEEENTSSAGAGISSSVAETIIARIEGVLALAEKYNITIPENLIILIDEAKSLLVNASSMVEEAPDKAIRLAILVARKFKPVAVLRKREESYVVNI